MLRVVTLADYRFRQEAGHLKYSLFLSNPDAHLTVYCDNYELFAPLASEHCTIVEIPEMPALGAKRSKLAAFLHAIESGSFLYLDADVIVLEPLDELAANDVLAGCPDDLSHCPYILDKQHPWPGAPELENRVYINSGIFYAPADRKPFFEDVYRQSRIDSVWEKYIFPGKLFDNHFFCAFLNLLQEPVQLLDRQVYGWQGLLQHGVVQVERRGEHLVDKVNGKVLRMAVFAGVRQSYEFLSSLPFNIASLLFQRIIPENVDPTQALASYMAAVSPQLTRIQDPHASLILDRSFGEMRHLMEHGSRSWRSSHSYFSDPDGMRAFACAQPASEAEWNGLKCGGAYLEGDEYNAIREMVQSCDIRTVLETGAGESSILFSRLGVRAVSVESQPGPWLDRAAAQGCTVLEVPFDDERGRFEEDYLRSKLQSLGLNRVDLLFIDSPIGTTRRRQMLSQFMGILSIRYVLYHDAMRDAINIFRDQQTFGLRLAGFVDSVRGLVLLETTGAAARYQPPWPDSAVDPAQVWIANADEASRTLRLGDELAHKIAIENRGTGRLSARLQHPVHISYHWLSPDGEMLVFEGERTPLPCDILAGDRCECFVNVFSPALPGQYELHIGLVQEDVRWFDQDNPACLITIPVRVTATE